VEATQVGVREFKARMAEYLRRVKAGEELELTDRGDPVCRLVPTADALRQRFLALASAGVLQWSGESPAIPDRLVPSKGRKTVAEMVIEDRG
jgi:prevent-host-death family protein